MSISCALVFLNGCLRYANALEVVSNKFKNPEVGIQPTSKTDFPYRAFIEQLQRVAEQLSKDIESATKAQQLALSCFIPRSRCHPRRSIRNSRAVFEGMFLHTSLRVVLFSQWPWRRRGTASCSCTRRPSDISKPFHSKRIQKSWRSRQQIHR